MRCLILRVEKVKVVELVNICIALLHCWFSCGKGDNDAGKNDDGCFIAGNGANNYHLRSITAQLFQIKRNKTQTGVSTSSVTAI